MGITSPQLTSAVLHASALLFLAPSTLPAIRQDASSFSTPTTAVSALARRIFRPPNLRPSSARSLTRLLVLSPVSFMRTVEVVPSASALWLRRTTTTLCLRRQSCLHKSRCPSQLLSCRHLLVLCCHPRHRLLQLHQRRNRPRSRHKKCSNLVRSLALSSNLNQHHHSRSPCLLSLILQCRRLHSRRCPSRRCCSPRSAPSLWTRDRAKTLSSVGTSTSHAELASHSVMVVVPATETISSLTANAIFIVLASQEDGHRLHHSSHFQSSHKCHHHTFHRLSTPNKWTSSVNS